MLRTFRHGSIEWFIDRDRRVVFGRWEGDVRGDEMLADSPVLWRKHPELGLYSAIHDLIDFTGIIEHRYGRELMRLRTEIFGPDPARNRTAIVSMDPMKVFEVKVATVEQPDRQFQVFGSNAAALAWVTADKPENPSDAPLPRWFDRGASAGRELR